MLLVACGGGNEGNGDDDDDDDYDSLMIRKPQLQMPAWHDDVIKWKYIPRYWPFVSGTDGVPSQRPVS